MNSLLSEVKTSIEFPSEKFVEDYVCSELEALCCPISGDYVDMFFRQYRFGSYGITDVVKATWEDPETLSVTILELKNEPLQESHLSQLCRYMTAAKNIAARYERRFGRLKVLVRGELAGPFDASKNDLPFLYNLLPDVKIFDIRCSMEEGFSSKEIARGWRSQGESFTPMRELSRGAYQDITSRMPRAGKGNLLLIGGEG